MPAPSLTSTEHAASSDAGTHPLLAARGLHKRFGAVRALGGVDFTVERGQVHVLLGENGAGKSTLIKCLSGVHMPDGGQILLEGHAIAPRSPRHAEMLGVSTVYQEVNLIPHLSVAENISMGREPTSPLLGRIRWGLVRSRAEAALSRLGIRIDVRQELAECSIAIRQLVAIARALDVSAKLLILDEPTSSLDREEVRQLFGVMRRLRKQGMGMVFITHFLDQVYEIADAITVLRDGMVVGERNPATLPRAELIGLMIGRALEAPAAHAGAARGSAESPRRTDGVFLRARNLGRYGSVEGINLDITPGEAIGLAGLLGSGRTETARLLFGADRADQGSIEVDARQAYISSPRDAMAHRIAMTTEDRKSQGIIPNLSVRENILLALQAMRGVARPISAAESERIVTDFIKALGIKTPSPETPISSLSGGNQQKILLARWLATNPRLLILDEPTRGIDVGAKAEIERLISTLRAEGMAVLLVGSDIEEVVRVCERIIVLRDRRVVRELEGEQCTEAAVVAAIAAPTPAHAGFAADGGSTSP